MAFQSAQARTGKGGSKKDFLTGGKQFEQKGQWASAIESYLAASRDAIDSIADLEVSSFPSSLLCIVLFNRQLLTVSLSFHRQILAGAGHLAARGGGGPGQST
jgi:hypothetical protein